MIDSRLYYDLKELVQNTLNFSYYTAEIDESASGLKSYSLSINQQEVLSTVDKIGIKNLIFNLNEAEFLRFIVEFKEHKDHIEELSQTDIATANIGYAKLWGPNELQRKFSEWFTKNGYDIPKIIISNKYRNRQTTHIAKPYLYLSKLNIHNQFKKRFAYLKVYYLTLLENL